MSIESILERLGKTSNATSLFDAPLSQGQLKRLVYPHLETLFNENARDIFLPDHRMVGCMDPGVKREAIGLGGGGLFTSYIIGRHKGFTGNQATRVGSAFMARALAKVGVHEISSHEGCGACQLIAEHFEGDGEGVISSPDSLGFNFSRNLTRRTNQKRVNGNAPSSFSHIFRAHMTRPLDRMPTQFAFYTGTLFFDVDPLFRGAQAFKIGRGFLEELEDIPDTLKGSIGKDLLLVAIQLALGDKGFGDLLSPESPFVVIPVGGQRVSLDHLREEAHAVVDRLGVGGRVLIEPGFDAFLDVPDLSSPLNIIAPFELEIDDNGDQPMPLIRRLEKGVWSDGEDTVDPAIMLSQEALLKGAALMYDHYLPEVGDLLMTVMDPANEWKGDTNLFALQLMSQSPIQWGGDEFEVDELPLSEVYAMRALFFIGGEVKERALTRDEIHGLFTCEKNAPVRRALKSRARLRRG